MPTFRNSTVPGGDHAILGVADTGIGVHGTSNTSTGTGGVSTSGIGVQGVSKTSTGVRGDSETGEGILGNTNSPTLAAIAGFNLNPLGTGAAIFGKKEGNSGHAGFFAGNVEVTGSVTVHGDVILANRDCAEDFDIADPESIEPGTVMVLGEEGGILHESRQAYDKRVAGVVSGAGNYKPGIVLGKEQSRSDRMPIALLGKVFCKVDASHAQIEVGDLLTTSPTPGHAMKASDQLKAFGAVIGKALRPLKEGQGLVPILIALQ
jgi:hypothetical protein